MRHLHRFRLSTLLALFAIVVASAIPLSVPLANAQNIRPKVAYIYTTDTVSRDSFKTLLEVRGFSVVALTTAEVAQIPTLLDDVQVVIIGDDTSSSDPYNWDGAASTISRSKYVIGVGRGGTSFFDDYLSADSRLSYGKTWFSSGKGAFALNPAAAIWNSPTPVSLALNGQVDLYTRPVQFLASYVAEPTSDLTLIGREVGDQNHYPLIAQSSQFFRPTVTQCNVLWGFREPPRVMNTAGRDAFINLVLNKPCTIVAPTTADVAITKTVDKNPATVGQPLVYTLTVTNNGKDAAPAVKVTDTLPATVTFVSVGTTAGSCAYSAGSVTCLLGTMNAGAVATVTIVVKPTEAGTLINTATAKAQASDPNLANNTAIVQSAAVQPPTFTAILALPYRKLLAGPIFALPNEDLSVAGIEITQGIQCFDTSKGLAGCADNSMPMVTQKDASARVYMRYNGPVSQKDGVPVRLFIRANGVNYTVNATGRARATLNQGSASDSTNIYFNVNFSINMPVEFYAIVDPDNAIAETNESNNRLPASGAITLTFRPRNGMKIVGQRLDYHPSDYTGTRLAGGWAVNGGAATWFGQLLPIKNNGVPYSIRSGYLDWTTTLDADGQHALIKNLNTRWLMENALSWLFGTGAFTGARHVYGWAPNAGFSGGHADMPVYPHAGGLGVVGIGTDSPGTSTDAPGAGALIFGHELVHDYNLKHTNTGSDDCGSDDTSSDFPYSTSSIQEFGFNPITGRVYDPASSHDIMSYCPPGGSKLGWISPFTWQRMFNNLAPAAVLADATTAATAESVLVVDLEASNPDLAPETGAFGDLYRVETSAPTLLPSPGDYSVELRNGETVLSTVPFTLTFKSEYSGHDGDHPGDPEARPLASASMVIPWVEGTTDVVLLHGAKELARRTVSSGAPSVTITTPGAAETWPAGSTQTLKWAAADPDGDSLRYSVFYSRDGAEWELLETGLTATSYALNVDALRGGSDARFRVVATDGINIGEDETDFPISVPDKAPEALIMNPVAGTQVLPDQLLVLLGSGNDFEDGTLPDASLSWSSDRQGVLGVGSSLPVDNLQPGAHKITLSVTDSSGKTTRATTSIYVGAQVWLPLNFR